MNPTRALILGLLSAAVAAAAFVFGLSTPPVAAREKLRAAVAAPAPLSGAGVLEPSRAPRIVVR